MRKKNKDMAIRGVNKNEPSNKRENKRNSKYNSAY